MPSWSGDNGNRSSTVGPCAASTASSAAWDRRASGKSPGVRRRASSEWRWAMSSRSTPRKRSASARTVASWCCWWL
nr:hypothetical protein [Corallococcus sp. CA049B]